MMFEPLTITAKLGCGVISDLSLPIDGILFSIACRRKYGSQDITVPGVQAKVDCGLPIEKTNHGPRWFYKASFAQWSFSARGQDYWNKRFSLNRANLVDFDGKRGKVITEQGAYKAYHMPVFYVHALAVSWCVVGDADEILSLLRFVTNMGKKASQGWGAVIQWNVDIAKDDTSVYDKNGTPSRAIPHNSGLISGYRPSYWFRENQTKCLLPESVM